MMNLLFLIAALALLLMLSIEDIKTREVSDLYTLSFAGVCLLQSYDLISALIGIAIIAIAIFVNDRFIPMGSGDVIVYGGFYAYFGLELFMISVIVVGVLSIIAFYVEKAMKIEYFTHEKGIVGMPFFFLSFLILNLFF